MNDDAEATTRGKDLTAVRRDLHRHPEEGWTEFRTTALVAAELDDRGFDLHLGSEAVAADERLGVPSDDDIAAARARARREGAPTDYLDRMGDVTGLVAVKAYGDGSGPVVGLRVDVDALARQEATDDDHRPAREGFGSTHPGEMHACGHDGHTAIGLGVARELDANGGFDGTLKLFFQPAEEGGRGGLPMSRTAHLDDVDHLLAVHLGLGAETGTVVAGYERPLSNAKLDVTFSGEPAHAGGEPNAGRNAMQALATAVQNLYAIPRHADGATRVNVGMVESANAQNVISEAATMRVEVRGETAALNEYVLDAAHRVLDAAADMHDCEVETALYGKTTTFECDPEMVAAVRDAAGGVDGVTDVVDHRPFGGSEDASYLVRRVQEAGGTATYVGVGASNPAGHHTAYFDIDEASLDIGVGVLAGTVRSL
ncbi:amidohydrolase [Candidatus Halobonum tyrrellensis]|uniref:Amidohydrolase n=1 Tax=Candidatus Halobonum tyrrellensis G22 TaxID=1324957 RepID=V4HBV5_9EURY|nr:amidohydrolase [Candidatus Halobonum tyrrellensis]ESP88190.1 amidohydrolase [Candidatus Halobonum tyrrellensis G22]